MMRRFRLQSSVRFNAAMVWVWAWVWVWVWAWVALFSTGCSTVVNRSLSHQRALGAWDNRMGVECVDPATTQAEHLLASRVDRGDKSARIAGVKLDQELFSAGHGNDGLADSDRVIAAAMVDDVFETPAKATGVGSFPDEFQPKIQNTWRLLLNDQKEFYLSSDLRPAVLTLGVSAILSNTSMDQEFADWYQDDVRSESLDDVSRVAKMFGEHWPMMGAYAAASLTGRLLDNDSRLAAWGDQSTRSMLVGVPPLLFLQKAIGSSRPNDVPPSSKWDFWNDENGASGHTFVGAVPFLVAAQMTDDARWKTTWTALSTLTGWSRINDNDHYLSHVIVGWWLAYRATRSVDRSNAGPFKVRPLLQNGGLGLGVDWNY